MPRVKLSKPTKPTDIKNGSGRKPKLKSSVKKREIQVKIEKVEKAMPKLFEQEGDEWEKEWGKEIPVECGYYWFYGKPFYSSKRKVLAVFEVSERPGSTDPIYILEGNFWYPERMEFQGVFQKLESPVLPVMGEE